MFVLKTIVQQDRDPSLLPSEDEIAKRASNAIIRRVMEAVKRAKTEREKK